MQTYDYCCCSRSINYLKSKNCKFLLFLLFTFKLYNDKLNLRIDGEYKMNKKGFTLVEILAVIIVLILIMLIAITAVNKVIEKARRKAFVADTISIKKAGLAKYASDRLDGKLKDDVMDGSVPGHVYYSIEDSLVGKYFEKDDSEYTGIVDVCYALDCTYNAKVWITNGEFYIEGGESEINQNSIAESFSGDYEEMINNAPAKNTEFAYTGDIQTYVAKKSGKYKLEVWGAQGGSANQYFGGYGAYATSEINLNKGDKLYVVVGGQGNPAKSGEFILGGYNGGGAFNNTNGSCASGGGATHIALTDGLLQNTTQDNVLIVAGGGGAATIQDLCSGARNTGHSGTGTKTNAHRYYGKAFDETDYRDTPAGGGIYGAEGNFCDSGIGGVSYIGNALTSNKSMYVYDYEDVLTEGNVSINTIGNNSLTDKTNCPVGYDSKPVSKCAKSGNGYAAITPIE